MPRGAPSPISHCDPGMSSANMQLVVLDVDGDAAINATPTLTATPEEGEHIVVQLAPLEGLQGWLDARLAAEPGLCVDARLYSFAAGFGAGRIGSSPNGNASRAVVSNDGWCSTGNGSDGGGGGCSSGGGKSTAGWSSAVVAVGSALAGAFLAITLAKAKL